MLSDIKCTASRNEGLRQKWASYLCLTIGNPMLRLNEVKLPLNHDEEALPAAILKKLGIVLKDMLSFEVHKRAS